MFLAFDYWHTNRMVLIGDYSLQLESAVCLWSLLVVQSVAQGSVDRATKLCRV